MTEFDNSVELAVRYGVRRDMTNTDYPYEILRAGTAILCRRVRTTVPMIEPCEVMAILGFDLQFKHAQEQFNMVTRVLLRNGWTAQQSVQFYENFRNANPKMFDVRLARLFTREQLRKTYGKQYGAALADILVEPRSNPLLYAMFYGNIMEPVPMVFRTAAVPIVFGKNLLYGPSADNFNVVSIPAMTGRDIEGHYLDTATAQRLYKAVTGGSLASSLTLSMKDHGLDYSSETQEALWQANRA